MLKISFQLKKSYWGKTSGSGRHSYLPTNVQGTVETSSLSVLGLPPQKADKEDREAGLGYLAPDPTYSWSCGTWKKNQQHLGKKVTFGYTPEVTDLTLEPSHWLQSLWTELRKLLAANQIPAVSRQPSPPRAAQLSCQPASTWNLSPHNVQPQPAGLWVSGKLMEALIATTHKVRLQRSGSLTSEQALSQPASTQALK